MTAILGINALYIIRFLGLPVVEGKLVGAVAGSKTGDRK